MTKVGFFAKLTNHQFQGNNGARQKGWRVMEVKKEKKEGFLADVKPSAEDLPEEQKSSEPDLGQGRKFVRPLGNLLREVMDQVDEEDEKKNNPQGDDSPPAEVEMGHRRHITPMADIMRQIAQPEIDAAREAAGEAEEE